MDITSPPIRVSEPHGNIGVRHAEYEQVPGPEVPHLAEMHLWMAECSAHQAPVMQIGPFEASSTLRDEQPGHVEAGPGITGERRQDHPSRLPILGHLDLLVPSRV